MKVQDVFQLAGKYSCLACCYIFVAVDTLGDSDNLDLQIATLLPSVYWRTGALDKDFTVLDGQTLLNYLLKNSPYKAVVSEKKPYNETLGKGYNLVNYVNGTNNHWVVADSKGKIIFNSLENSVCVKNGKPKEFRNITIMESI